MNNRPFCHSPLHSHQRLGLFPPATPQFVKWWQEWCEQKESCRQGHTMLLQMEQVLARTRGSIQNIIPKVSWNVSSTSEQKRLYLLIPFILPCVATAGVVHCGKGWRWVKGGLKVDRFKNYGQVGRQLKLFLRALQFIYIYIRIPLNYILKLSIMYII